MANGMSVAQKLEKRRIEEWEIRDAASTIVRAEEIRNDKELMPKVEKELERRKKALETATKR